MYSKSFDKIYVGHTSRLEGRLIYHNQFKNCCDKIEMQYEDQNNNKAKKGIVKIVGSVIYSIKRIEAKALSTGDGSSLKNY